MIYLIIYVCKPCQLYLHCEGKTNILLLLVSFLLILIHHSIFLVLTVLNFMTIKMVGFIFFQLCIYGLSCNVRNQFYLYLKLLYLCLCRVYVFLIVLVFTYNLQEIEEKVLPVQMVKLSTYYALKI